MSALSAFLDSEAAFRVHFRIVQRNMNTELESRIEDLHPIDYHEQYTLIEIKYAKNY